MTRTIVALACAVAAGDGLHRLGTRSGVSQSELEAPLPDDETVCVSTRASTAEAEATNESLHAVVGVRSVREDVLRGPRGFDARRRAYEAHRAGVFGRALLQKSG